MTAPGRIGRRAWLGWGAGTMAAALAGCAHAQGARSVLTLLGEVTLPHRLRFAGTTVGGLSAIDFDPATGLYDLLSDDRSDQQPARLYRARITVGPQGLAAPELVEVITLRQADGQPWPRRREAPPGIPVTDPEAMRRLPTGNFLWTSEGDLARGFGAALMESRADGTLLREFELPAQLRPGPRRGIRNNASLEGLALMPDARTCWAALESPLLQDGPLPSIDSPGAACRFTQFDVASGRALGQIAYRCDAIPLAPLAPGLHAENGVSEILAFDARRLLVLERSYSVGRGNSLRLYVIDPNEAGDTLALDALQPGNHQPVAKTLLADFSQLGLKRLENTEGMTWGPPLPDGRRTLVVVSDDNFNRMQATQFAAFALG